MTTTRERAALKLCRFHPCCVAPCPECCGDVDAVLDAIREPGDAALVEGAATIPECAEFFRKTHALNCHKAMIDAIRRGEG